MDRERAIRTVTGLIAKAIGTGTPEEEARTTAMTACRLIAEHGLLGATGVGASKNELRQLTDEALLLWLDFLWSNRKKKLFVPVRKAVDMLAAQRPLDPFIQEKLHVLVRRRASALRAKGVLVATRGTGGFRMSPTTTRGAPRTRAA